MLELMRRYQKFLFLVITFGVVISFSFFGTFSIFTSHEVPDRVAFTAVDGSSVYASQIGDLANLLSGDSRDLVMTGSGNAFNDGVIADEILGTQVVDALVPASLDEMKEELNARLEKEKNATTYTHPHAPFLSSEQVWAYFAPDVKKYYDQLRAEADAASLTAFHARAKLYMAERHFPAPYLKQFLHYQENQHAWLEQDSDLPYRDLSLFSYHSLQDWFGRQFIELSAGFILNAAKIAEKQGITVSKEEVLQSIVKNAENSYKEYKRQNQGAVLLSFDEYFQAELRKLGMDQARLMDAWGTVLLFRRLMNETADSILVSDLPYKGFYQYLDQYVEVESYKLPKELQLRSNRDVARFDIYANAIRDPRAKSENSLFPPTKVRAVAEVQKIYPELVEKRYRIRFATANKSLLETKVGVKKAWEWQLEDKNWKKLQEKFPEIGAKRAASKEERRALLDAIDSKTRGLIDAFARTSIVDENSQWLQEALASQPLNDTEVYLREQGGKMPFEGIQNRKALIELLDNVPLNSENPLLSAYTQDNTHYFRIMVVERAEKPSLMTFKDALSDGTMDSILDKTLEAAYPRLRGQKPTQFVRDNGEWKPFSEVKDALIEGYLAENIDAAQRLNREIEKEKKINPQFCNWDSKEQARAACRLLAYMKDAQQKIAGNQTQQNGAQQDSAVIAGLLFNSAKDPLREQFKLVRATEKAVRGAPNPVINIDVAFTMAPGLLSEVTFAERGGLSFFKVIKKGKLPSDEALHQKVYEARKLLGQELRGKFASTLVSEMRAKGALDVNAQQ